MTVDDTDRSSEPRQTSNADAARKERMRQYHRARYLANRESRLEADRAKYAANREAKLKYAKEYRAANRELLLERDRIRYIKRRDKLAEYGLANRERKREYNRAWYLANREKKREYDKVRRAPYRKRPIILDKEERRRETGRARYAANSEMVLADKRAYRDANREKWQKYYKDANRKRRAREAGSEGSFTASDWDALVARSKCCHWCKKPFSKSRRPTHDHVIPISKGGANTIENSVCACKSCNSSKHARLINPVTGQGILL